MTASYRCTLPLVIALSAACAPAHAGDVYAQAGLPGVGLGYAQPLSDRITLRADFSTLGSHRKTTTEEGINYTATLKANRLGLLGDWFVFGGGFRLTGGLTVNDAKVDLLAQGNGQPMTIGSRTFVTASDDRLQVQVKFPRTTPYLGIGWGHQVATGVGFLFDAGASFGRATLSESHSGTNLGNGSVVSQADIDAELAQLREGVGKMRVLPQLSIGLSVRF